MATKPREHQRIAISTVGTQTLSAATLSALLIASGVFAISLRVSGSLTGIAFLRDVLPAQALYLILNGCLALLMIRGARALSRMGVFATLSYFYLLSMLALHVVASPPAAPDAWNTGPTELARAFALQTMMLTAILVGATPTMSRKQAVFCLKLIIATGVFMVAVACLQLAGLVPHFYFQWYQGSHLPRPTGGLEHPHFFAVFLVLAIAATKWLRTSGSLSRWVYWLLFLALSAGIIISTSRVGVLAFCVYLLAESLASSRTMDRLAKKLIAISSLLVLGAAVAGTVWILFPTSSAAHFMEVFTSAFISSFSGDASDGEFLRGRGSRWGHEIDLIMADPMSMLFGYGHQPFVSHNLILRQLQVSGLSGTTCYIVMLGVFLATIVARAAKNSRPVAIGITASVILASLTFPVFVSITIISAISLLIVASSSLSPNDGKP